MIKSHVPLFASALLALALTAMPWSSLAQTNKAKPTTETKEHKKPVAGPFHGKLAAVDKSAKTISVGKRTFQINSETRIAKSGKPATLDEGVIGEEVSGYVKPMDDGKLVATKVNFGPKMDTKEKEEKKKQK